VTFRKVLFSAGALWLASLAAGQAQQASPLMAGAAKVDITPAPGDLPPNFEGILDHLYARAIVLESGGTRAALVSVDIGGMSEDVWRSATRRIEREFGIPTENLMLTATHTHSAPFNARTDLADLIVDSVGAASARVRPAQVGYGTGVSYLNVNRNIIDPDTRRWWPARSRRSVGAGSPRRRPRGRGS